MNARGEEQPINDDPLAARGPRLGRHPITFETPLQDLPTRLIPVGTRVGAVAFVNDTTLDLYGYGIMLDDAIPPAEGLGCEALHAAGLSVPVIRLDTQELVYGPECSYAEAAVVARLCLTRAVTWVSIETLRARARDL